MFYLIAYAQTSANVDNLFFKLNEKIINPVIEFAFIIAFVVFIFGVMEFIRGANSEEKRTKGKEHMMYGLIGFVIMFGVFGIIKIITNTFGINGVTVNKDEQKVELPKNFQNIKFPK